MEIFSINYLNNMNKKNLLLIIISALVVVLIVVLVVNESRKPETDPSVVISHGISDDLEVSEESRRATEQLLEETIVSGQEASVIRVYEEGEDGEVIERELQVVTIAPGTSVIDLSTGQVLTEQGKVADTAAASGSQSAPQLSFEIKDVDTLPASTIRLEMSMNSVSPAEFTVERGQLVNLAVTNVNDNTFHIRFRFDDPSLAAVMIGCAKGDTKSISFNAPAQAGEYTFYNSMFDHRDRGSEGVMIVR
jgi:hypothetical protein